MRSLSKEQRLRRGAEFRKVFQEGVRVDAGLFRLSGRQNEIGQDRLGLAVSRKVGGAVVRSRGKRLLREAFRRRPKSLGGIDLVVVAKPAIEDSSQQEVDRELGRALERLLGRIGKSRVGGTPRPPGD